MSATGPQREIFSGGTKIDAGPQTQVKQLQKNQKRSPLKFGLIFCPKLGKSKKKKVFTQIWSHFLPKSGTDKGQGRKKNWSKT